jgi:hypothetical protein
VLSVCEEAIQRVASGMGGRVVAPLLLQLVEQSYAHNDWKYRRAAVAAVTRLSEGTVQTFVKSYYDVSVQFLLRALNDPCQIVRYEAAQVQYYFNWC